MKQGLLVFLLVLAAPVNALNILLCNDDGFETANLRALYQALGEAGHDVMISAPVQNQSGQGAAINVLRPIGVLAAPSRYGTLKAGAPGVGVDPGDKNIHYVDGTPVMAALYGIQLLAPARWQGPPDVLISGPNEGNNLGAIVISSGTVGAALTALSYGIPAIAVSYQDHGSRSYTSLKPNAAEFELAALVLKVLAQLQSKAGDKTALLPDGLGLNINIPQFAPGKSSGLKTRYTRIGGLSYPAPYFYSQLSDSRFASERGLASPLPGISVALPGDGSALPIDTDSLSEGRQLQQGHITISPLRMTPAGSEADRRQLKQWLHREVK